MGQSRTRKVILHNCYLGRIKSGIGIVCSRCKEWIIPGEEYVITSIHRPYHTRCYVDAHGVPIFE